MRGHRKVKTGIVLSHKTLKTAIVSVERRTLDKRFKKVVNKFRKFMVHDAKDESQPGDLVQIVETPPLSKEKRWCIQKILKKAASFETVV